MVTKNINNRYTGLRNLKLAAGLLAGAAIFSGLSAFDSNQSVSFNSKPQEPRATFHLDKEGFAELVSFN